MTNQNNDLPVNPPGISFEDWAALLTGGQHRGRGADVAASGERLPCSRRLPPCLPPSCRPWPSCSCCSAGSVSVPPLQPSQVTPAASDPLAEALEASWRESLRQEALRDASQVQNPEPVQLRCRRPPSVHRRGGRARAQRRSRGRARRSCGIRAAARRAGCSAGGRADR